jgi:ParB-like chromosome segregation protein Spo0J
MFDGLRLPVDGRQGPERERQGVEPERRGAFAGFRPDRAVPARDTTTEKMLARDQAVQRHARALTRIWDMQDKELPVLPHQKVELQKTRQTLDDYGKHVAHDMEAAYRRDPALARETAAGGATGRAIQAMHGEREIRLGHERRAEEWIETFKGLDQKSVRQFDAGNYGGHRDTRALMSDMAKQLERDPQLESMIAIRKQELGLQMESDRKSGGGIGRELARLYRLEWELNRGLGL